MVYIFPNTLSTFNGDENVAYSHGFVGIEDSVYADLVETKKMWQNGEIVDDPTYEQRKAEEAEAARQREIVHQVNILKRELATYDYIGVKIAMGVSTREDYAEQIEYTETLREQIRALENQIEDDN